MQAKPRLKPFSVWESYDIRQSAPAEKERKWRACLGHSGHCAKRVRGFKGDRLCNACKNLNDRRENPGKYSEWVSR